MSKIEKALRKARENKSPETRGAEITRPGPGKISGADFNEPGPARVETSSVPVTSTSTTSSLAEKSANSTATIPFMQQPAVLDSTGRQLQKIIVPEAAENATITALREIRTKIMQRTENRNCVIMVTGTSLGSGTTFTSINLATAFALDAARTALAIDCNIRDPALHRLITGEIKTGLTNFLTSSRVDLADIIQPTGIARLRVIPAGVDVDPTVEYFTMERMRRLVQSVRERYPDRNVILDCPPIARSADAQILQQLCDYVVVVVPYAGATPSALQAVLKHIDSNKLLGVVINREPALPDFDWKAASKRILRELAERAIQALARIRQRAGSMIRRSR
jgi:capsular exopolysaccharide synthesis family protein